MSGRNGSSKSASSYFTVFKTRVDLLPWKASLALVLIALIGCQAQTFQYSRGWTNGKRSGYPAGSPSAASGSSASSGPVQQSPVFEMENGNGLVGVPVEDSVMQGPLSVGSALRMGLPTQGRLRSLDYAQYLNRKLASATGNVNFNHKPPMWIVGLEQENNNGDF